MQVLRHVVLAALACAVPASALAQHSREPELPVEFSGDGCPTGRSITVSADLRNIHYKMFETSVESGQKASRISCNIRLKKRADGKAAYEPLQLRKIIVRGTQTAGSVDARMLVGGFGVQTIPVGHRAANFEAHYDQDRPAALTSINIALAATGPGSSVKIQSLEFDLRER